jgi:hypothetical protein
MISVICQEGLIKASKDLSQDSRSPGRDSKPGPFKYEAGVLTTPPRRSVIGYSLMLDCFLQIHLTKQSVGYSLKTNVPQCFHLARLHVVSLHLPFFLYRTRGSRLIHMCQLFIIIIIIIIM